MYRILVADDEPIERLVIDKKIKAFFPDQAEVVLAETGNYFTFEKKWGTYTTSYDFNIDALRSLGCDYIISASYFIEPEKHGLKLLNEDDVAIETPDSWYRLFVYEIDKNE